MVETERIELPDGQYWVIRKVMSRGMERAITRATLTALPRLTRNGKALTDTEAITEELLRNLGNVDVSAIEDAYLLHGTVEYSFGPQVTQEIIDGINADMVRQVINRMFALYNPQKVTEGQRQDFFETQSSAT